jgi:hypothetical protein
MRINALLLFFPLFCALFVHAQVGMYVNVFNNHFPNQDDAPAYSGFSPLIGGGFITAGYAATNFPYLAIAQFDSTLNRQWINYYHAVPSVVINRAPVRLKDNSNLLIYGQGQNTYLKTSNSGSVDFFKRYLLVPNFDLSSDRILPSTGNDSGFVTLFSECALNYSLAKFDRNGNNIWAYEYVAQSPMGANIYHLEYSLDTAGYLTCGNLRANNNPGDGIIVEINDSGGVEHTVVMQLDAAFPVTYLRPFSSESEHCYYAFGAVAGTNPAGIEPENYLIKFDSTLNPLSCWKLTAPGSGAILTTYTARAGSDGKIVLCGVMSNPTIGWNKFYVMKFDPATGTVEWCKTVRSVTLPVPYSFSSSYNNLFINAAADEIVYDLVAGNDGASIAGMRGNGTGLCISRDTIINVSPYTAYSYYQYPVVGFAQTIISVNDTITRAEVNTTDEVWCNTPVSVAEAGNALTTPQLIQYYLTNNQLEVTSQSSSRLHIRIYNAEGKLLGAESLAAYERFALPVSVSGIYFVQALAGANVQTEKIIVTD